MHLTGKCVAPERRGMVYEKVKDYCERNKISISKLEEMCGFGNGTIGKWNGTEPKLKSIITLADKTGIPVKRWISD